MSKGHTKHIDYSDNTIRSDQNLSILNEVAERVKSAGKTVRELADDTQEKVLEIRDAAENRLRTNPLSTCAMIFASGVIIGALVRRR